MLRFQSIELVDRYVRRVAQDDTSSSHRLGVTGLPFPTPPGGGAAFLALAWLVPGVADGGLGVDCRCGRLWLSLLSQLPAVHNDAAGPAATGVTTQSLAGGRDVGGALALVLVR